MFLGQTLTVSLKPLQKAVKSLQEATTKKNLTQLEKDGIIQRFEYTFELSWKTLRRYLELNNKPKLGNLKDIFREAGRQKLISSVEEWFQYLEARNLTSHTYDEKIAQQTFQAARHFSKAATELLDHLKKNIHGNH